MLVDDMVLTLTTSSNERGLFIYDFTSSEVKFRRGQHLTVTWPEWRPPDDSWSIFGDHLLDFNLDSFGSACKFLTYGDKIKHSAFITKSITCDVQRCLMYYLIRVVVSYKQETHKNCKLKPSSDSIIFRELRKTLTSNFSLVLWNIHNKGWLIRPTNHTLLPDTTFF